MTSGREDYDDYDRGRDDPRAYMNPEYHRSTESLDYPGLGGGGYISDGMTDVPLNDRALGSSPANSDVTAATVPVSPTGGRRMRDRRVPLVEVRQNITYATNQAGRAIATGTNYAGRAIANGTNVAGRAIANGTNVAGRAIANGTNVAGRAIANGAKQGFKTLTQPMEISKFGVFDVLTALVSVGMFYFDVISDILVAYYMYDDEATHEWFLATVLLLVIPLVVVNGFSLYWYWFDERVCEHDGMCPRTPKVPVALWFFRVLGHLMLHASILRTIDLLYFGIKSIKGSSLSPKEEPQAEDQYKMEDSANGYADPPPAHNHRHDGLYYQKLWIHAERDAANVDLLSSLVQDAPQLILQIYIMANTIPEQSLQGEISTTMMMQLLSVAASLVAMAFSVGSFTKATRLAEPSMGNLSAAGLMVLSLAHFCCIGPQVLCFSLFATKYLVIFFIVVSCHWLAASILILFTLICCPNPIRMNATFTHDMRQGPCHRIDDVFFSAVFGLILLYTFVDVGGKKPKIQGAVYHFLRIVEECCMIAFWYMQTEGHFWYQWLPLAIVSTFFLLSIAFSAIFFYCVHPDRKLAPSAA
ncbi:XK-related protein 8-like [Macrobrachium rosenbergii]|uniref:XK-related protein 8-like n=1 Tax=Macrobrachium rosenbergii TaxID=79674 RepID=UPI0034D40DD1